MAVTVSQLEAQRAEMIALQVRGKQIERLYANHDFIAVIVNGFGRDDAVRYMQEAGDPMLDERERADSLAIAMASGHLKRYLAITLQRANIAERTVHDIDDALLDARQQEDYEAAHPGSLDEDAA
jgi:hypothetical protein